jgi:hypothetical protein
MGEVFREKYLERGNHVRGGRQYKCLHQSSMGGVNDCIESSASNKGTSVGVVWV